MLRFAVVESVGRDPKTPASGGVLATVMSPLSLMSRLTVAVRLMGVIRSTGPVMEGAAPVHSTSGNSWSFFSFSTVLCTIKVSQGFQAPVCVSKRSVGLHEHLLGPALVFFASHLCVFPCNSSIVCKLPATCSRRHVDTRAQSIQTERPRNDRGSIILFISIIASDGAKHRILERHFDHDSIGRTHIYCHPTEVHTHVRGIIMRVWKEKGQVDRRRIIINSEVETLSHKSERLVAHGFIQHDVGIPLRSPRIKHRHCLCVTHWDVDPDPLALGIHKKCCCQACLFVDEPHFESKAVLAILLSSLSLWL